MRCISATKKLGDSSIFYGGIMANDYFMGE